MKLAEMFDKEKAVTDFEKEKKHSRSLQDRETSLGDLIISQFETGELTFRQAKKKLKDKGLRIYQHELNMADELRKRKPSQH